MSSPTDERTAATGGSSVLDAVAGTELDLIIRGLTFRVGAQAGVLALSDEAGEVVEVRGTWGGVLGLDNLPISLTGEFLARALMFDSAALEPIESGLAGEGELTHAAGAAVGLEGGLAGALCVAFSGAPDAVRQSETLRLIESYGQLLSLGLAEPGMLDALFATAHLDGLTGCLNYAALHHELEREIRRSERHDLSLSCCFIDLDRFKLVNDRHGHLYGSAVLADVARTLGVVLRGEDTLGRYGGDEFVAILPETNEAEARQLADRVRTTISTASQADPDRSVDASIGVAQWRPGSSAEALLAAADEALREAKAAGGGQVVGASRLSLEPGEPGGAVPDTSTRPHRRSTSAAGSRQES